MSRDFAIISPLVWRDLRLKPLGVDAILVYLFLHTSGQTSMSGCVFCPPGVATTDLPLSDVQFASAMQSLERVGLIEWDRERHYVFIVDWYLHNKVSNAKWFKGVFLDIEKCPSPTIAAAARRAAGVRELAWQEEQSSEKAKYRKIARRKAELEALTESNYMAARPFVASTTPRR